MNRDEEAVFLARVEPEPNSGCWLWTGSLTGKGYGRLGSRGKTQLAHRVSYTHFIGPIAQELDHKCRVRSCVNPAHLRDVTRRDNNRAPGSLSITAFRPDHCLRGHPLNGENLYVRRDRNGGRECRECQRLRSREYQRQRTGYYERAVLFARGGIDLYPEEPA